MDRIFLPIIIVAIVFGALTIQHYLRHRTRMAQIQLKHKERVAGELQEEMQAIRERLSALEQIVTDKGYRVREEIDKL